MGNKVNIIKADENKVHEIRDIAYKTWPISYLDIISDEQINFMLDKMYDINTLIEQINKHHHQFYILYQSDLPIGFVGFEFNYDKNGTTKIHKLYVLPETKGLGYGKMLMDFTVNKVKEQHLHIIVLNVNKKNPALQFYLKYGFKITEEVVLDIGNNFVMDDYLMQLDVIF